MHVITRCCLRSADQAELCRSRLICVDVEDAQATSMSAASQSNQMRACVDPAHRSWTSCRLPCLYGLCQSHLIQPLVKALCICNVPFVRGAIQRKALSTAQRTKRAAPQRCRATFQTGPLFSSSAHTACIFLWTIVSVQVALLLLL